MSLRSLSLLVLVLVAGTAASVRWYLEADAPDRQELELSVPAPSPQHVPLPMRAEPARSPAAREPSMSWSGVALRGQVLPLRAGELRVELQPTGVHDGSPADGLPTGAFVPLQAREPR